MKFASRSPRPPFERTWSEFDAPADGWVDQSRGEIAAPILAFATAAASVASAAVSIYSATKKPKVAKAAAPPPVVPLPTGDDGSTHLRLLQTQNQMNQRQGYQSTLVSGALGDTSPPPMAAPLVLGRAA